MAAMSALTSLRKTNPLIDIDQPSDGPTAMPILRTQRLEIRPMRTADLADCHQLYKDIGWADSERTEADNLRRRRSWVDWSVANERELGRLAQPPMGERTVIARATGAVVGLVGLNPSLSPFGQLPSFGGVENARSTLEVGLFWAISPAHQGAGLATEAAQALIDYMFDVRRLARIVATTEHDNHASQAVMRRLGMTVERNPWPEPAHFQTVGVLDAETRR
jgi:RimJ/RimL family protein N-acetyltransferase